MNQGETDEAVANEMSQVVDSRDEVIFVRKSDL